MKVKTIVGLLLAFFALQALVNAQSMQLGFGLGSNITLMRSNAPAAEENDVDRGLLANTTTTRNLGVKPPGFTVGGFIEDKVSKSLLLRCGLYVCGTRHFTEATVADNSSPENFILAYRKDDIRVFSVQAPIVLSYHLTENLNLGIGFFGSYNFTGIDHYSYSNLSTPIAKTVKRVMVFNNQSGEQDYMPFDAGIRLEAGCDMKNWRLTSFFDYGLTNVWPNSGNGFFQGYFIKRSTIGLLASYLLRFEK